MGRRDSEVATAASISPVPQDPQHHPGLTCTCCSNFVGCGYVWRCIFVFYFTVRFSACSSRSQVSPSDQKLVPALDTTAHSNQHPRLPYPACMPVSCPPDWESLKTVLFSSGSPLPAHNLSLAHKDGCLLDQWVGVGVRNCEPKPRLQPTQPYHLVKDCSWFVSDVTAPPPLLLILVPNLSSPFAPSEREFDSRT